MNKSGLNYFEGILYINLNHRTDRNYQIQTELEKTNVNKEKIFRIEGHFDELNGSRGCVKSHIAALEFAIEKGWKNVLILEDDCEFTTDPCNIDSCVNNFAIHFNLDWDVFFLGTRIKYSLPTDHIDYVKVQYSMRAHAYAVNASYLTKLRDHYISTCRELETDLFFISSLHKALDRRWVDLQLADRWFAPKEMIAFQRSSFSDIEKAFKDQR